ncbi:hypothetical protein D3C81_1118640 [compost metagenome]
MGVRVARSSESAWRSVFHWLRLSTFGGVGFICEARAWLADIRSYGCLPVSSSYVTQASA